MQANSLREGFHSELSLKVHQTISLLKKKIIQNFLDKKHLEKRARTGTKKFKEDLK